MEKLYRCVRSIYDEVPNINTIQVFYQEFDVIKETEKSYLIKLWNGKTKRVYKNCKGSFAFENKDKAFENFKYRTTRSLQISKYNLKIAQMFYDKYAK